MNRLGISYILTRSFEKVKSFLVSKDLLIFLFFLAVSIGLWTLHALRKNYETVLAFPIKYANIPQGMVETNTIPTEIKVRVIDNGTVLTKFKLFSNFDTLSIKATQQSNGLYNYQTSDLTEEIQKQLNSTTQILNITPNQLQFKFEELKGKLVPVKLVGSITIAQQYSLKEGIKLYPSKVMVYATQKVLDTLKFAYTEPTEIYDIKGNYTGKIQLENKKNIAYSQNSVFCKINTEQYTEKIVNVKIITKNVQEGYELKTFPSTAKVSFHIGLDDYKDINANNIEVIADYNQINGQRIPLTAIWPKDYLKSIKITPETVQFVIEKTDTTEVNKHK